nr:unnamed protein product [Digitaria exilis]
MSWLARSIAATLSSPGGEPDADADADESESEPASAGSAAGPGEQESSPRGRSPNGGPGAEEPEQPGTPSRGVKDDISELTETLTRRLWGFPLKFRGRTISPWMENNFELSDAQYVHALSIEHLVPGLSDLKIQICSTDMTEACFWKIYFVLLHSKLNKQDAELLSTPQILEAREQLLQSLRAQNKRGSKFPGESSDFAAPAEERVIQPSSIQDKAGTSEVSSFEEPSSDIMPERESEKFSVSTTDEEIVDKSVIEEELAVKNDSRTSAVESKLRFETDEDEVDEWPDDEPAEEVGAASHRTSLGREEDVSFSDLEDDEDDDANKRDGQ